MDPLSEIREKIKRIANGNGSFTCFTAKVVSVDGETCDVELDGMKLTDVRLRAVVNGENSKILGLIRVIFLRLSHKQSDRIVIEDCGLTDGYMLRSIAGQIKSGTIISEVIVHSKNGNRILYKKTEG